MICQPEKIFLTFRKQLMKVTNVNLNITSGDLDGIFINIEANVKKSFWLGCFAEEYFFVVLRHQEFLPGADVNNEAEVQLPQSENNWGKKE